MPDQINIPSSGVWSSIATALNSMFSILFGRTGWASYNDTQYSEGSPFVLPANTDTTLPNNAGTIVDHQKPVDVASFYSNGLITGRDGDALDVMVYFKAKPSAVEQSMDVWIDIGGSVGELYRQTFSFPKGAGVELGILYALPSAYTLNTWETNGGSVKISSASTVQIYNIVFNFDRTHKAR